MAVSVKCLSLALLMIAVWCQMACNVEAEPNLEAIALLRWKESLPNQSSLHSWNQNVTTSPCKWFGISCNTDGSIKGINLANATTRGNLSYLDFSSFPNLVSLDLSCNILSGQITPQIGTLLKLTHLNLSMNYFSGYLPSSLANLTRISLLYMGNNLIQGALDPHLFTNWTRLEFLELHNNNFTGEIPSEIGLLTSLIELALSNNHFLGSIPSEIGNLKNLDAISLYGNHLTGPIPPSFGNLSKLTMLYLHQNELSGPFPYTITNCKHLSHLLLYKNHLSGSVPQALSNLTSLKILHLSENNFSGHLPEVCQGQQLQYFTVAVNSFTGPIPKSMRNCASLVRVRLERNQLSGILDQDFGVYPNLDYFELSYNKLTGVLSPNWGKCKNLRQLKLVGNVITGKIPGELGQLKQLGVLDLSSNQLVGEIPTKLGKLSTLYHLNVSDNQLSGQVPHEIKGLSSLENLDLSANKLRGPIPEQIGKCLKLRNLCLSKNYFNGSIPFQIGNLALQGLLDLSQNLLAGDIPPQLGNLIMLEHLNLSRNNLSGSIPSSFNMMTGLSSIDLSYNDLEGAVPDIEIFRRAPPTSFSNNKDLCGEFKGLRPCNVTSPSGSPQKKKLKAWIIGASLCGAVLLFATLPVVSFIIFRKTNLGSKLKDAMVPKSEGGNLFSILNYDGKIVYEDIIEATKDFDDENCIGLGSTGRVYKAKMASGHVLAIKKLWSSEGEEVENETSFRNEIHVLKEIRHRNIVKFYGFCSHRRHKFLVYDYIDRGSLAEILKNDNKAKELDWSKRVEIVKGVANALYYMHRDCRPPIIHRDISSKNVLVNTEYEACLSDFGISKIMKSDSSNWTQVAGTYGYVAPELAYTMKVTEKCDIYSFGVLALEVIMGTHPKELVSSLTSSMERSVELKEVLDPRLPPPVVQQIEKEVMSTVMQALSCLHINPDSRPTMREVSHALSRAQSNLH